MADATRMSRVVAVEREGGAPRIPGRTAFVDSAAADRGGRGLVDAEVGRDDHPVVPFCSAS